MASTNKITKIERRIQNGLKEDFLDFSSRYNRSEMVHYSDFNILTFETYERIFNPANPRKQRKVKDSEIKFFQITLGTQYKPWLISQSAYQDPGYWWYIMEFNNLFDVEEIVAGKTIKIPPIHAFNDNFSEDL